MLRARSIMECPKCHTILDDNSTVCPRCHKVFLLECPNCHTLGESPICQKCGYTILTKCSKCSKMVLTSKDACPKCGFSVATSVAYQECESDDFAAIVIKFGSLKKIKRLLKSQELYSKFFYKLKNLLVAQIKGIECKFVIYNDVFVINMSKELSFATSSNKAVRLALKIVNAFVDLNANIIEELSLPLNLTLTIVKKRADKLLNLENYENNVKPLTLTKKEKKYLRGLQIILDQYVVDEVHKDYKTDSLYSIEEGGQSIIFYEIILDSYVLPPNSDKNEQVITAQQKTIPKNDTEKAEEDIYGFKNFDINAKCTFDKTCSTELFNKLKTVDLTKNGKIIAIKTTPEYGLFNSDIADFYLKEEYRVITITCTEEMTYKPWGFFTTLFKEYFGLPYCNKFIDLGSVNANSLNLFKPLFDLYSNNTIKAMTSEDSRFAYMELWNKFLSVLNKTVIIVDGFEKIDDTSLQTLELYFDKFKSVKPNFFFITSKDVPVHSKIKGLLRTPIYTEFTLCNSSLDSCLATLKSDATDFIQSFYFEKIKEYFNGSYLYFQNAIEYLKESGILINFENKLLIKNKKSVILPKDLAGLYKSRMKGLSKNADISFILAYVSIIGARIDIQTLQRLGVKDVERNVGILADSKLARYDNGILNVNNYNLVAPILTLSLKKEAEAFLVKNVIAQLGKGLEDSVLAMLMGRMGIFKEEYLTLWKNAQFAIKTGDYDAYLKNCLGFLSLVEHIESNISEEEIEENKKDVYNNILMFLYNYSPAKIYFIENILLMDAINQNDDEKIVKLSNLMLQGALISSNYTDALGLLHNILSRMKNPTLKVDGNVNTKFLLLSLVNMEILYNIGDYRPCVEIAEEILSVLSADILEKVKPASFSTNLFVSHLLETFRLAAMSKLFLLDKDLPNFFDKVKSTLNVELPEKDCILAIKDYLAGKVYSTGNMEEYSAFSKIIFLILQEFSKLKDDYKTFAQNIYQAKLLALEIHQHEIEMFCDLLIAYAYAKIGITKKAESIYNDVLEHAEESAMFNILSLAKYFLAQLKAAANQAETALLLINDTLALTQKYNNQSKIIFAIFEKLYIEIVKEHDIKSIDIDLEEQKLVELQEDLGLILNKTVSQENIEA